MKSLNSKKIVFVGGGTLGSVTPLINVWQQLSKRSTAYEAFWIGSKTGPEIKQVAFANIEYFPIYSGKLRRYLSLKTFIDPFKIVAGFFQSLFLLIKLKPSVVVGAGSFVQVPVCVAAHFLKIPMVIYQMDVKPGLANVICSKFATDIAVALPGVKYPWDEHKQVLVGAVAPYMKGAPGEKIVIFGGGTGAQTINDVVAGLVEVKPLEWQIIHVCGEGKINKKLINKNNYFQYETMANTEMLKMISDARVVICRAGMGTLFEIGALGKPAIIIPMPDSHQEDNASYYAEKDAIIVIKQEDLEVETLMREIEKIIAGDYPQLQKNIATITNYDGVDKLGALILRNM